MSETLEAKAAMLGIPMQLNVDDKLRYSYCDAHMANLVSIEGKNAVYKGECANGHQYEMEYEIEELKRMAQIVNGEIVFGGQKGYQADSLEEY